MNGPPLAGLLLVELLADGHLPDDVLHRDLQPRALPVVGGVDVVHPPLAQQLLHPPAVRRLVDGDGLAAVGPHHLHAGHVGEAVPQVDHVGEGHPLAVVGHGVVELPVVGDVQDALVDAVDELGLGGKVHRQTGPDGVPLPVVVELAGVNLLERPGDGAALDDLPQAGGDHIVLHLDAQEAAVAVDPLKPVGDAGEEGDVPSAAVQPLAGQGDAPLLRLPEHGVHIGQDAVHFLPASEVVGDFPEVPRGQAQGGDEGVVLHILGTEGFVEVVEEGDNGLGRHWKLLPPPPSGRRRVICGPAGRSALFLSSLQVVSFRRCAAAGALFLF